MGRFFAPAVRVTNNFSRDIKVKVDPSRCVFKLVKDEDYETQRTSTDRYSSAYELFKLPSKEDIFQIIKPKETHRFSFDDYEGQCVFLTVWINNNETSWIVYCQNHPITKNSKISITKTDSNYPILIVHSKYNKRKNPGIRGIRIFNVSSKNVWIRIGTNDIRSINTNNSELKEAPFKVYRRAPQGQDYTEISSNQLINFFLNTVGKKVIPVFIYYETSSGSLKEHSLNYEIDDCIANTKNFTWIMIRDYGEGIMFNIEWNKIGKRNNYISSYIPCVKVTNNLNKEIKVKVDASRSFVKLVETKNDHHMEISNMQLISKKGFSSGYEVFHVASTAKSFIIIHPEESQFFELNGRPEEYAFLTIWIRLANNHWSLYCENHPIMRHSEIVLNPNPSGSAILSIRQIPCNIFQKGKIIGEITVNNCSSKNVWVRIDTDHIKETEKTVSKSGQASVEGIPGKNILASNTYQYTIKNEQYYRAEPELGYTQIDSGKSTIFFLNTLKNRIFISIDYQKRTQRKEYCNGVKRVYWTKDAKCLPELFIKDFKNEITYYIERFKDYSFEGL